METQLKKIEIGCGKTKTEGFIGVDRYPLPGVDIVTDINQGLPFDDNCADVVWSCHSLEHFDDLKKIVGEIFRICKNKAIVLILAPYYNTTLNISNFYHKQILTEDTFRFFSHEANALIDKQDYYCPHSDSWGLADSDNSETSVEMTILSMEYFYYPAYAGLDENEKRRARRALANVCDQIYYALAVNKTGKPFDEEELSQLKQMAGELEPPIVAAVRNRPVNHEYSDSILTDITKNTLTQLTALRTELAERLVDADETNRQTQLQLSERLDILDRSMAARLDTVFDRFALLEQAERAIVEAEEVLSGKLRALERQEKDTENELRQKLKSQEKDTDKALKQLLEQLQNLALEARDKSAINALEQHVQQLRQEKDSLSAVVLELMNSSQAKSSKHHRFTLYRKNGDLFEAIRTNFRSFTDMLLMKCDDFKPKSILSVSRFIPFYDYLEYQLKGYGNTLHYFIIAALGARLFVEVVQDGVITKQETIDIDHEGHYCLRLDQIKGKASVRFRTLDNKSIVRVLEIHSRFLGLFLKKRLAAYVIQGDSQ